MIVVKQLNNMPHLNKRCSFLFRLNELQTYLCPVEHKSAPVLLVTKSMNIIEDSGFLEPYIAPSDTSA